MQPWHHVRVAEEKLAAGVNSNLLRLDNALNTRLIAVTKTATYTMGLTDDMVLCDATAGAFTVNLPAAAQARGMVKWIKKIDSSANAITIDPNGAETIDGFATVQLTIQYMVRALYCDGSTWWHL